MCSTTLSMSMYSYGCVAAVGVSVCVSCCIFMYDTTRAIPIIHITDNNTNRISTIVITKIMLRFVKGGSVVTGGSRKIE